MLEVTDAVCDCLHVISNQTPSRDSQRDVGKLTVLHMQSLLHHSASPSWPDMGIHQHNDSSHVHISCNTDHVQIISIGRRPCCPNALTGTGLCCTRLGRTRLCYTRLCHGPAVVVVSVVHRWRMCGSRRGCMLCLDARACARLFLLLHLRGTTLRRGCVHCTLFSLFPLSRHLFGVLSRANVLVHGHGHGTSARFGCILARVRWKSERVGAVCTLYSTSALARRPGQGRTGWRGQTGKGPAQYKRHSSVRFRPECP